MWLHLVLWKCITHCLEVCLWLSLNITVHLVSYITFVPIGNKLLVACAWFLFGLTASACGLVPVVYPTYILATYDIGRSDLACLAHNRPIASCMHCQVGCSCIALGQNGDINQSPWLWTTLFSWSVHISLLFIELMIMWWTYDMM